MNPCVKHEQLDGQPHPDCPDCGTSECWMPSCDNPVGESDRDDYRKHKFCSVQCDVKYAHIKADAEDARRADEEEASDDEPVAWSVRGP